MLDPRTLTHVQLATIVTDVQKILWQESKPIPDFPREYGDYWNPGKEEDDDMLEQIADVLADADLKPSDCMPIDVPGARAALRAGQAFSPKGGENRKFTSG